MYVAMPDPSLAQPKNPPRLWLTHSTREFAQSLGITPDSQVFCRESEDGYSLITDEFDSYDTARKYCDLVAKALEENSFATTKAEMHTIFNDWYDKNVRRNDIEVLPNSEGYLISSAGCSNDAKAGPGLCGDPADNPTAESQPSADEVLLFKRKRKLLQIAVKANPPLSCPSGVRDWFGVPDRMSDAAALECLDTVKSNSQADARHALSNWAYTLVGDEPRDHIVERLANSEHCAHDVISILQNAISERKVLPQDLQEKLALPHNMPYSTAIECLQAVYPATLGGVRRAFMNWLYPESPSPFGDESTNALVGDKPHNDHAMRLNKRILELIGEKESLTQQLEKADKTIGVLTSDKESLNNMLDKLFEERRQRQTKLEEAINTLSQHKSTLLLQLQQSQKLLDAQCQTIARYQQKVKSFGDNRFLNWQPSGPELVKARLFLKRFVPGSTGAYSEEHLRAWQCVFAENCGMTGYDPLANKPPTFTHIGFDPSSGSDRTVHQAIINDNGKLRSVELPYVSIKAHDDAGVDSAMWLQEFLNNTETGRHIVANAIEESEKCVGIVLDKMASGENPQEKVADSNS